MLAVTMIPVNYGIAYAAEQKVLPKSITLLGTSTPRTQLTLFEYICFTFNKFCGNSFATIIEQPENKKSVTLKSFGKSG